MRPVFAGIGYGPTPLGARTDHDLKVAQPR